MIFLWIKITRKNKYMNVLKMMLVNVRSDILLIQKKSDASQRFVRHLDNFHSKIYWINTRKCFSFFFELFRLIKKGNGIFWIYDLIFFIKIYYYSFIRFINKKKKRKNSIFTIIVNCKWLYYSIIKKLIYYY